MVLLCRPGISSLANRSGVKRARQTNRGLLRGYQGEYRDKIPLNHLEIAPAVLPSIGVQWGRFESDLIVFGTAGMMVTAGVRF